MEGTHQMSDQNSELRDDEIATERKLPRRSFLTASGATLAGLAGIVAGARSAAAGEHRLSDPPPDQPRPDDEERKREEARKREQERKREEQRKREEDRPKSDDPPKPTDPHL
jgi:hypothetical protein